MTILCYHAVQSGWRSPLAVEPAAFAAQAAWLAAHRQVLPLSDAVSRLDSTGRLPKGLAVLTFDDGFSSVYEHALPQLRRHQLPATVFLVAETLTPAGRVVDWVDTPPSKPLRTLTADQVLEMQRAGIQFESHSYSHHDLMTLSFQECLDDLRKSRQLLSDLLSREVKFLAYPRGRHDEKVRRAAELAGYTRAFALPQGPEQPNDFAVPRVGVFLGNGTGALRAKTHPAYLTLRTGPFFATARRLVPRGKSPIVTRAK